MSDTSSYDQFTDFLAAIKQRSAIRILELGTSDSSFSLAMLDSVDWAPKIEFHCTDDEGESFDKDLIQGAEGTNTEFEVTKHVGSESEVNEAILHVAESCPFDAIYISSASSKEALLTAFLVSNESLKSNGVIGLSVGVMSDPLMTTAIASFNDMLGNAYERVFDRLFVKV
jgi:hypothetical protein